MLPRKSKYGATKTTVDEITFDSKAEARMFVGLQLRQRAGEISNLERQVTIQLVPGVKLHGAARARPAIRLVVDFRYTERGQTIWLDCKGMETPMSLAKRHMALALHGIEVRTAG